MRAVIQRVTEASVVADGKQAGVIGRGLLVLVGIESADTPEDVDWLAAKITAMRIFGDANGQMNLSVKDVDGGILVVSQFTLHAQTRKGNRPSYILAAKPEVAIPLYEAFLSALEAGVAGKVQAGIFGADMKVSLVNDGPVTILIDTKNRV